jgi:hypothetical protein
MSALRAGGFIPPIISRRRSLNEPQRLAGSVDLNDHDRRSQISAIDVEPFRRRVEEARAAVRQTHNLHGRVRRILGRSLHLAWRSLQH